MRSFTSCSVTVRVGLAPPSSFTTKRLRKWFRKSLQKVAELPIDTIVQGHGEVILRGEVKGIVETSLAYLDGIEDLVAKAIKSGKGKDKLRENSIESCGLSRIPLNGLVQQIHVSNLLALYDRMVSLNDSTAESLT